MSIQLYTKAASYYHWIVAAPLIGSVGAVLKSQQVPKEEKGEWMWRHKSLGLLTGIVAAPRLAYRVANAAKYKIGQIPGTGPVEGALVNVSHLSLYVFMTLMPATGIAMGYYGGNGLPFFFTIIPGVVHTDETKAGNVAIAKQSFSIHKQVGEYGKWLIPIHVGGALTNSIAGRQIWSRVNPFGRPRH